MRILLISPLMDIPTITSNLAVAEILEYAKTKLNTDIELLFGLKANRIFFDFTTTFRKFDAIIYFGHGRENSLAGNHIFWSMINRNNVYKTRDTPYSVMACHSAAGLGKYAVKNGTKAYFGSTEEKYAFFPEKERDFLADWIILETTVPKLIMDGKTFGEAYKAFIERCNYFLELYQANIGYKNYDWYYDALKHNRDVTILLGDPDTKIV